MRDFAKEMRDCIINLGGTVRVTVADTTFRCKPGFGTTGDLMVSIYRNRSTHQYHALPLADWVSWAQEYAQ